MTTVTTYSFTARKPSGEDQTGVIEAASPALVAAQLRDRGLLVIKVDEQRETKAASRGPTWWSGILGPRSVHVELSLHQLAVMLRGGISLLAAMETIAQQSDSRAIRHVYRALIDQVQQGVPLSQAMQTQPGFPLYVVRLVQVGERTGIQETVLVQGAEMMKLRRTTVREVGTALTYPAMVLAAGGGATAYMVTSLIPKLTQLLQGMGKPLPAMTQSLVTMSEWVQRWGLTALALIGALLIGFVFAYSLPTARLQIDRLALRLPVIGKIFRLSGTLTFSQTLGTLIHSGVTVLDGLVTVQQMHANSYLASIVQQSRDAIIRGNNLAETLRTKGAHMPLLATMTAVGEQSGNLDETLDEVTRFHQAQLTAMIAWLGTMVTPAIIVLVGSIIGYVYIAFFLGMFAIAGS